jgi:hypothetical protein
MAEKLFSAKAMCLDLVRENEYVKRYAKEDGGAETPIKDNSLERR